MDSVATLTPSASMVMDTPLAFQNRVLVRTKASCGARMNTSIRKLLSSSASL